MTRPWVRLALVFAGFAAIAAAGFVIWSSESRTRAEQARLRQADDAGRRVLADAADLRAAQQSYVAVGQGEEFWFARVTALSKDLDDVLSVFKGRLASSEAVTAADEAAAAIRDFQQVDTRAREYARAGQQAQASDIIFGDGFDVTQKIGAAATRALTTETVAADAAFARTRREELTGLSVAAGGTALGLLLLMRRSRAQAAAAMVQPESNSLVSKEILEDLNDFDVVSWPSPPAVPEPPSVDLAAVAEVCTGLARVTDTRAVPALLERAATILDASGIVLWIADPDGRELSPILVHGYPPQLATRLGTIARDAGNVTAAAYRTGLLQTVKGDTVSNGAIAAPLVGAGGCLGVM